MRKKVPSGFTAVNLLFGLAIGCLWGLVMADYCLKLAVGFNWLLTLLLAMAALVCLTLAYVFQVFLHELGHFLFGRLSGYRFVSFQAGIHLLNHCGLLFRCVMCPPAQDEDGYYPISLYSLGGIIMNLLSGLLFLWLYFISGKLLVVSLFSLSSGILGLGLGLMHSLPAGHSDGYNALWLSDDEEALHAYWLHLREAAEAGSGV